MFVIFYIMLVLRGCLVIVLLENNDGFYFWIVGCKLVDFLFELLIKFLGDEVLFVFFFFDDVWYLLVMVGGDVVDFL